MALKVPPHLLSLLILFLSLCLTSLALRRDPETAEVLRCLDECSDEDVQEYIACHEECELRYREREERGEEEERPGSRELDPRWRGRRGPSGGGGGGEWEPEGPRGEREPARGPQVWYDQCRRLCEPFKRRERERERCWEQCEERERGRERRRDREREREVDGGVRNPPADPSQSERYERCKRSCERQTGGQQRQLCKFRCRQQREREERETPEGGDVNLSLATTTEDPQQQFRQCQQRCDQQHRGEPQRGQCRQECKRQFREQRRGKRILTNPREQEEEEEEEMGEWGDNPYYFHSRTLRSRFRSEEGRIRVLERFDRRSDLLRGLKNYRLEIFEANPNTFVLPHHIDADSILLVLKGEGTISLVGQEKKESHHLERGDVIRVPAGTTVYFASSGGDEVQIAKLIQPANTPGKFEEFYPVGTENPESYYTVFSSQILESSLRTSIDQIERLFGQQRQGVIIGASEEQLRALSEHRGTSKKKKKGHGSKGPFNLLAQKPIYSNEFGRFFHASPEEFTQLQDSDVSVTFVEVDQGSIMVPHYNSKSTMVVVVVEGYGWFEMACPHLARARQRWRWGGVREQEEEEDQGDSARYQKVTSLLSPGDVFVIPAGHPIAIVAEQNKNLTMAGFGINAEKNQRIFLAGKENIINQMDREAKELSFDLPAREVDCVFGNQEESYFVSWQQQPQSKQREHGKTKGSRRLRRSEQKDGGDIEGSEGSSSSPIASMLDLAGLF